MSKDFERLLWLLEAKGVLDDDDMDYLFDNSMTLGDWRERKEGEAE